MGGGEPISLFQAHLLVLKCRRKRSMRCALHPASRCRPIYCGRSSGASTTPIARIRRRSQPIRTAGASRTLRRSAAGLCGALQRRLPPHRGRPRHCRRSRPAPCQRGSGEAVDGTELRLAAPLPSLQLTGRGVGDASFDHLTVTARPLAPAAARTGSRGTHRRRPMVSRYSRFTCSPAGTA